ncbi:MAG: carbohydrate binding family 9 domain-containing protein [Gemmatimonadaceae bacterium]|nr:carbohydrate binding family 9 domain-containing protein [Gemmatimonadaceae bacterium]
MTLQGFRAAAGVVLLASSAMAQSQGPTTPGAGASAGRAGKVAVTTSPPTIDGRLDDAVWREAELFTDFVQREPLEGTPVSERTEVRVATDGQALYVAAWLYDRDAASIVPSEKIRDVTLTNSDYFGFILDTYHDRQNGFLFGTTPSGVEHDAQIVREGEGGGVFAGGQTRAQAGSMGGVNLNWDASWTVATSTDSAGWYAEFRIPFSTIRYGAGATQTWGFNIMRGIRRRNEEALWSRVNRQFNIHRLSQAGTLEGVQVPVKRIATVTPYVLGQSTRTYATQSEFRYPAEWGLDAKYGVTPSLTLDLTYNTDFAQVEVDEQRTNLTRFPIFFPEKRPFFLENAGVFSAGTPQAVDLFFTRRIGIDSLGQVTPIIGGGRLTGRVGGLTVGALQMFTDDVGQVNGNSYTVGRVLKEISSRSRIGVIGVQRQRMGDSDDYNRVFGVDGRLGVGQAWTFDAWASKSQTKGRDGDDAAFSGRAEFRTRDWNNNVRFLQVGEDFNPEVGFMGRPGGYRFYDISTMRLVRSTKWTRVRQWNPHVNFRGYYDMDGYYQNGTIHVDVTEVELNSGARFGPEMNVTHEGLQVPFAIAPGVNIPVGSYDWAQLGFDFNSNPSAPLSFSGRTDFGPFYNGTRNGGNLTLTARKGSSISSSLLLDYQDVNLDQGSFIRKLVGLKFAYFFTPRVFFQSLTQYNNQQQVFTSNLRFAWLNTAGTGLFIVFNDGQTADGFTRWRDPIARSFTVKYTRQIGSGG